MIPASFQPNLNTDEMNCFVADETLGPGKIYYEPPPIQIGFSLSPRPKRPAGSLDELIDKNGTSSRIVMFWTRLEHYTITEGDRPNQIVISDLQIAIPCEQKLRISVWAHLYFRVGSDAPSGDVISEVETAFTNYDYAVDGNVDQYTEQKLNTIAGLKRNMVNICYSFSAAKIGCPKIHEAVRDAQLAFYANKAKGQIYTQPQDPSHPGESIGDSQSEWLKERKYAAIRTKTDVVKGFPNKTKDILHEQDLSPGADPTQELGKIANQDAQALDCNWVFTQHNYKILTLFEFPEFMVEWREKRIVLYRDDCGNEISITMSVPVLRIRYSQLNLWAYMRYPDDADQVNEIIRKVLETCAIRAALSGAVVGVALGNFAAALAAFKAVFQRCIDEHLNQIIKCMIPGLSILTEVKGNGWEDLIAP